MADAGNLRGRLVGLGVALSGFLLLTLVGLYLLVQSQIGLAFVAGRAGEALSDSGTTVRITGLKGSLTSSLTVETITIADHRGIYAEIRNARVAWKPSSLFGRLVELETVSIDKISVSRLPETDTGSTPEPPAGLSLGFGIKAPDVKISEVALAPAVLGEAQRLTASASAALDQSLSHAALGLSLKRIDGGAGEADIALDYAANPARFKARVKISEPTGGLLSRLAGLPRGENLMIDVSGTGPPDDWRGNISVAAGRNSSLNSAIRLSLKNSGIGIVIDGAASPGTMIPSEIGQVIGARIRVAADAEFTRDRGLKIGRFSTRSRHVTLSGNAHYDFAGNKIKAAATGKLHNGPPIGALLPGLSVERLSFDLNLDGSIDAPNGTLSFQTNDVAGNGLKFASGKGTIKLRANSTSTFDLEVTANVNGIDTADTVPAGLNGSELDVKMSGKLSRTGTVSNFALTAGSGPATVTLSGTIDNTGQGRGRYNLRLAQIEELTRSVGGTVKGNLGAAGQFQANLNTGAISASVDGELNNLETSPSGRIEFLGDRVPFSGQISQPENGPLTFEAVKITSPIGRLTAAGNIDTATHILSASLTVAVPELSKLRPLTGKPLAGKASMTATLTGPIAELSVTGKVQATDVAIDDVELGSLSVAYDAQLTKNAAQSKLHLNGLVQGKTVAGSLDGLVEKGTISLSGIDVAVGKNKVAGNLDIDTTRLHPSGALKITLSDIRDLPGADQLAMTGSGTINLKTVNDTSITMAAEFLDIRAGDGAANKGAVEKAAVQFRFKPPFTNPTATGSLDLDNFWAAGLRRGKAKITIDGTLSSLRWLVDASASSSYPFALSANGDLSTTTGQLQATIEKLDGKVASQEIRLNAPFAVSWRTDAWRIAPVELSLAGGQMQFGGSLKGGRMDAVGEFNKMPLRLASLASPRLQIDGTIAGKLRVSGNPLEPEIALSVTGSNIRPPDVSTERFPGFDVSLNVIQNGKDTVATGSLTGPEATAAAFTFKTRPLIRLSPVSLDRISDTPISGKLTASGRLDLIDRIVGLGDDRIAGRIDATADLSGTFENPIVKGKADLTEGSYEGTATGTTLRNIEANAVLSGDHLKMVSLTANDGADGQLSGSGSVRFSAGNATSKGISIRLDQFTALRHPLAEAVVSGDVSMSGSLEEPLLTARLTIIKGDIQIPEKLPPQVVQLDVVEINGQTATVATATDTNAPPLSKSYPVSLDIAFTASNRTFVRGRGLNSEWKGDILVSGTSDAPVVKGKLEAIRGTFAFAGKTFVVKSGSVTFPAGAAEPDLDVAAEAELKDLTVRVEISGSLSKPTISISSEPSLPQEDVLAQVLFGRTTGQLSPIQAAQLAQTAATLSGKSGPGIVDKVRQTLGVDVLNVESDDSGGTGASLKAGKYLTEDVFLSVTQGTKAGSQKIGVEVQVLPNITVESDVSGNADSNIGIKWKWDY